MEEFKKAKRVISIEPYSATYEVNISNGDGTLRQEWRPCRVLGIVMKDRDPAYLIQLGRDGQTWLETSDIVRPVN